MLTALVREVSMIVLDVDGVLTDGKIIVDGDGKESKNFYVRDGLAIAEAVKAGYKIIIISGRHSPVVDRRAKELKIHEVHQGWATSWAFSNRFWKNMDSPPDRPPLWGTT